MKILHVINSLHFGGAEKLLFDTIPDFKNKGLDVELMVLNKEKTFYFEELEERFNIRIITPKKVKSIYSLSHILWIRKYIDKYDIVHVHLFPSLYWVGFASIFKKNKARLILTEHNTNNRRQSILFFKYLDRYIYKKYSKIIAISEGVKENIKNHLKIKDISVKLIHNGVNTNFFKNSKPLSRKDLSLPEQSKVVIQVSSFYPQKDHDTLLKAIALLPEDIHLLLVGDGVLIEEKKSLATKLGICKRVHFLGHRKDVNRLLKTADVCVLSSNYEGFGISIVEGMAAEKPCLASNVSGMSEVMGNSELLFEPKNHIQLKEKLQKLFSDDDYYNKISKQCQLRAKDFDISLMIEAHINLYKELA